jgi:WASH complex subunit strumpellin
LLLLLKEMANQNDFFSENNLCGQTILRLVSRGNAVIAELFRLSDYIPPAFVNLTNNKYSEIIFDFKYLSNQAFFDNIIETKVELQDLDDEFKNNQMDILKRFYLTFESVHKYVCDLNRFIEDLEEGIYIQQNLDTVLFNEDGKQLLAESIYLYGLMLLIIDIKFEGVVRERLLVAYLRYSAQKSYMETNIDDVCKLLRTTGFSNGKPKPNQYPESYFSRIIPGGSNSSVLSQVIGRLRTDDIYNQMNIYPQPEHRSHALANQASMLYIILYFRPEILNNEQAVMREIVDKFFPDNWIISVYMGNLIINLGEVWERYPAARNALANTLTQANIKQQSMYHANKLNECIKDVNTNLNEGFLTEEYLLTNINKATSLLKQTNCTLKWLILHTSPLTSFAEANKKFKQIRDQIMRDTQYDAAKVLDLALNLSQLEHNMKEIYKKMINDKHKQWDTLKNEAKERTFELSEVFSGSKPLTRIEKNDNLQKWFELISTRIENLNFQVNGNTSTGREITQLVNAIQEVLHYHEIDKNLQVKQFINDTANYLVQMISTCNIKEDALLQLDIISDISYAWLLIDNFTQQMQQLIKKKPKFVIKLRALFLKLSLVLNLPLVRIVQSNSQDIKSVTQYYSNELVSYVRKVLQIIPESMFGLLARIINIQTNELKEVPTRLEKDKLKEYAQLEQRYSIANLTYSISLYTEGILQMKSTIIGYIPVEAKQLLEDGIRKELVKLITHALHTQLQFNAKTNDMLIRLDKVNEQIDGYRRSFEYIQDYVNIYGLKIWQEEFSRIIYFHVEQECNLFMKKKVHEWESMFQSKFIPIPVYPPLPNDPSVNFIGRLAREIIRITDPKLTCYIEQNSAWYDFKTKQEIVNLQLFRKIDMALDSFGLNGLDRLFSFMIVRELEKISSVMDKQVKEIKNLCEPILKSIQPLESNLSKIFV